MKKEYIAPIIEVINMDVENIIAMSILDKEVESEWSNKRQQPTISTWSSTNWNSDEE
ncbi:MAG: hypothetical protein IKT82_04005 [Bacteroidaceae bacterium]|nr:hypothetical protein [Bacteroidaceae bacterium]